MATWTELGLAGWQGRNLVRIRVTGLVMTEVNLASCGKPADFHSWVSRLDEASEYNDFRLCGFPQSVSEIRDGTSIIIISLPFYLLSFPVRYSPFILPLRYTSFYRNFYLRSAAERAPASLENWTLALHSLLWSLYCLNTPNHYVCKCLLHNHKFQNFPWSLSFCVSAISESMSFHFSLSLI